MQKSRALTLPSSFKHYWALSKPGIIFGNLLTALSGFALAATLSFSIPKLITMLLGIALVMASSCALNNCIDRALDSQMKRTQKRPLVTGVITLSEAFIFAALSGALGLALLIYYVSLYSALAATFGMLVYVLVYSFSKYHTPWCTLLGSFAGASPVLVGYLATSKTLDLKGLLLFSAVFCWQMPHFYAIAIFRLKDYAAAKIPVLPAVKGMVSAKNETFFFTLLYALSIVTLSQKLSMTFSWVMYPICLFWILLSILGFGAKNDRSWAKRMFFFSLFVVCTQSLLLLL